jgi:hypothetical protein
MSAVTAAAGCQHWQQQHQQQQQIGSTGSSSSSSSRLAALTAAAAASAAVSCCSHVQTVWSDNNAGWTQACKSHHAVSRSCWKTLPLIGKLFLGPEQVLAACSFEQYSGGCF